MFLYLSLILMRHYGRTLIALYNHKVIVKLLNNGALPMHNLKFNPQFVQLPIKNNIYM